MYNVDGKKKRTKQETYPVQMPHPLVNQRIATPNVADIALEMLDVDRVESHGRGIQPDISLCDVWTGEQVRGA